MGGTQTKSQEKELCIQLHNAIADGNGDAARELLMCRAVNPNNKLFVHSRKLDPPLFTAVENNCLSLVEMLLQYDAKISTFNRNGCTPLHVAVAQNLEEIAETLIRHNANPSAPNLHGESSLHVAATYGLVNMTELLLSSGASVNSRGKLNRTPLHSACAIPGNTSMAMSLLNHGADPDLQDEELKTPLHYLAQLGNSQGIDILLQAGACKNSSDVNGKSALHVSVESEEISATRALLRHQCDVNWQDSSGQTPLYKATEKEYSELVSILLLNGADANIPSSSVMYPIRTAVWKKNINITKSLLDNGANVNATDRTGITPLHVACLYGNIDEENDISLVEILLGAGANIDAQCSKHRRTPLHNAVECGNEEIVVLLLQNGANSSLLDSKGKSALSLATTENISNLLTETDGTGLNLTPLSRRREQNETSSPGASIRRMNFYTRPNPLQANNIPSSATGPPPIPPRDNPHPSGVPFGLNGTFPSAIPAGVPIIRHNFTWSARDSTSNNSENHNNGSTPLGVAPAKLLTFSTNFPLSNPHIMCHSITSSKQTINTDLGCTLHIPSSSVHSSFLLYVEGNNYSQELLPLPSGHYLCSNLINFYTHTLPSRIHGNHIAGENPEREIPHFQKPITVKFVLRPSALAKFDENEHEFKVFASFDESVTAWEELECQIEKILHSDENGDGTNGQTINLLTVETDELGTLVAMLCPKQDSKQLTSSSEKITSSVDPTISASVSLNPSEKAAIDLEALKVTPNMIEQMNRKDFSYVVGSSREVRLSVKNDWSSADRLMLSIHLPCTTVLRTNPADVTHRIMMKSEKWNNEIPFCSDAVTWKDVTETECQQLNISQKGKKLLQNASDPVHHVSFRITTDVPVRISFIVVAVRSYTSTLSNHLVALPKQIAKLRNTTSVSFLVNQKSNRACEVTCDVVPVADANQVCSKYRRNGSYKGPPPSLAQEIQERDCIVITAVGGLRLNQKKDVCRRIMFHSALLPFNDRFYIKGTSCHNNTASKYTGNIEFSIDARHRNPSTARVRSPLNSESSVLVMENALATEPSTSASHNGVTSDKKILSVMPVELPRKAKSKKVPIKVMTSEEKASRAAEKSFLNESVMLRICKSLDEPEVKELAFQLGIDDEIVTEAFTQNSDNLEKAGMHLLKQWRLENAVKQDVVAAICLALRCIGRDNVSQDVSRRCNPFLENSSHIAALPVFTRNVDVANSVQADGEER
uniref:Ankyrin giant isoform n=1 Tax=Phallusia mammillata TaxID=59560 RepID=A0A6F9D772_9ASCI|nr:ankyrin giant isoform [Phallusia mammillata]